MPPHANAPHVERTTAKNLKKDTTPAPSSDNITMGGGVQPLNQASAKHSWHVLAILSALMGFASISTDLYLPAMPAMGRSLGGGTVEWTVSGYLIGFSLGQLLWGPIGDRYGRRLPVAIGLVLFVIGSAGCALAGSMETMIAWRVVQAVGACAGVVLARAMVRDLFAGDRAAQMLSTLMTVMAIAPLLGPIAGGQILALAGWRAIFWTLAGIGLATLVALWTVPETLSPEKHNHEPMLHALARYGALLRNQQILGYAGAVGFFYAGMFAYIAGTPFAYITYHHVSPQLYGVLLGIGVVGIMISNIVNSRLVGRFGIETLLKRSTSVVAFGSILLAVAARTGWGGLAGLMAPSFVVMSAMGFIVANSITGAMAGFPERAGAVSALVGSIQYGSGIIGSALVGAFADGTPWPMGWIMALAGIGSLLSTRLLVSTHSPRKT